MKITKLDDETNFILYYIKKNVFFSFRKWNKKLNMKIKLNKIKRVCEVSNCYLVLIKRFVNISFLDRIFFQNLI